MRRIELIIDSTNFTATNDVTVCEGTIASFLSFPSFKTLKSNNWYEYDGIEVDLSDPKFKSRTATLNISCRLESFEMLMSTIMSTLYHTIVFNGIGVEFNDCRYINTSRYNVLSGLVNASLQIAIDEPVFENFEPLEIRQSLSTDWMLDVNSFSDYKVNVLDGAFGNVTIPSKIKGSMSSDVSTIDGVIYDRSALLTKESRTVSLTCLIRGAVCETAVKRLLTFMYAVTRPSYRILAKSYYGYSKQVYYDSMSIIEFMPSLPAYIDSPARVDTVPAWIKFNLKLKEL